MRLRCSATPGPACSDLRAFRAANVAIAEEVYNVSHD